MIFLFLFKFLVHCSRLCNFSIVEMITERELLSSNGLIVCNPPNGSISLPYSPSCCEMACPLSLDDCEGLILFYVPSGRSQCLSGTGALVLTFYISSTLMTHFTTTCILLQTLLVKKKFDILRRVSSLSAHNDFSKFNSPPLIPSSPSPLSKNLSASVLFLVTEQ